jgi:hypothetical protein
VVHFDDILNFYLVLFSATKSSKSDKSEGKHIDNKHTSNVIHGNTPEKSPKRKRTPLLLDFVAENRTK